MSELHPEIGNNLKRIRKESGLTQAEVAQVLAIDRSTYTYYEKGRVPSIDMLRKLSAMFGIPVPEILGETPGKFGGGEDNFSRLRAQDPEPPAKDFFLLPQEKLLIMRFRICGDEDKRRIMEQAIELALQSK